MFNYENDENEFLPNFIRIQLKLQFQRVQI